MKPQGFNLLELLIVLSIIGILFAYALPDYTAHFTQARRLMAETALMKLATALETYFTEHNTYEGANFANLRMPEHLENHYRFVIQAATSSHFRLAAIPQESQAERDRRCGTLLLDSRGEKQISGKGSVNDCW